MLFRRVCRALRERVFGYHLSRLGPGTLTFSAGNIIGTADPALVRPLLLSPAHTLGRSWLYRFVARNRYRWFGRAEACMVPRAELQERFLD